MSDHEYTEEEHEADFIEVERKVIAATLADPYRRLFWFMVLVTVLDFFLTLYLVFKL